MGDLRPWDHRAAWSDHWDVGVRDHVSDDVAGSRRVTLPQGRTLVLRPVSPDDVDGLAALYEGLSADDLYRRFFSGFRPSRGFLQREARIAARGGFGLVAVVYSVPRDVGRIVAEASYELLPNGNGDLAITVAPRWRGWLGPFLFDALLEAAAARGVPNLEADVLAVNRQMLALVRWRGCALVPSEDWTSVRVVVGTRGRMPTWPRSHERPRVLVEIPGGRWSASRAAQAAGLQVLVCSGPREGHGCPALSGEPCPLAAAADAIVVSHSPDDESWHALVEAHQRQHPGVPVCVECHGRRAPAEVCVLPDDDSSTSVVDVVGRVARAHAGHADGRAGNGDPADPT